MVCPEGEVAQCYALCFVGSPHCPEASEEEEECRLGVRLYEAVVLAPGEGRRVSGR